MNRKLKVSLQPGCIICIGIFYLQPPTIFSIKLAVNGVCACDISFNSCGKKQPVGAVFWGGWALR